MAASFTQNPILSPEALFTLSGNVLAGPTFQQGIGAGVQSLGTMMAANKEKAKTAEEENQTRAYLQRQYPDQDFSSFSGDTLKAAANAALSKKLNPAQPDFKILPDGTYGTWDGQKFNTLGTARKPEEATSIQRDLVAAGLQPGTPEYQKAILENYRKNGGQDDYANREAQALKLGMKPDDPRYQSFILTGKLPREDQQSLTAVDKKAILDADEMVAVNKGAIDALKQARELSPKANAGWLSGTRATIGNNLPDWMIPDDYVSSPESSEATQNFDNAIVGQALTQLKAIFGGAPTEGERKILLDLQGSSNLQPKVREAIIDRAIAAAERRLAFNQQRADEMRGGTFYKPNSADTQQTAHSTDPAAVNPVDSLVEKYRTK